MRLYILLFLVFISANCFSQTQVFFNTNSNNFPNIKTCCSITDTKGKILKDLNPSDFVISENGVACTNISIINKSQSVREKQSIVFIVDASICMSEQEIKLAKKIVGDLANYYIKRGDECAITSFNNEMFAHTRFTQDSSIINSCVNSIYRAGLSNLYNAWYHRIDGIYNLLYQTTKQANIFFISNVSNNINPKNIVDNDSNYHNYRFNSITLSGEASSSFKDIVLKKNGFCFERILSEKDVDNIIKSFCDIDTSNKYYALSWKSSIKSPIAQALVTIKYLPYNITDTLYYKLSDNMIMKYNVYPEELALRSFELNKPLDTVLTIVNKNYYLNITDIISDNPNFTISPNSFTLEPRDSIKLKLTFNASDYHYQFGNITFISSDYIHKYSVSASYPEETSLKNTLKITNAPEYIIPGGIYNITWTGVSQDSPINMYYSLNKGLNWTQVLQNSKGDSHYWRTPSNINEDSILLKIDYKYKEEYSTLNSLNIPLRILNDWVFTNLFDSTNFNILFTDYYSINSGSHLYKLNVKDFSNDSYKFNETDARLDLFKMDKSNDSYTMMGLLESDDPNAYFSVIMTKTDLLGNKIWSHKIANELSSQFVINTSSLGAIDVTYQHWHDEKFNYDLILRKFNSDGKIIRSRDLIGSNDENITDGLSLANGSYTIIGNSSSIDGDFKDNTFNNHDFIMIFDSLYNITKKIYTSDSKSKFLSVFHSINENFNLLQIESDSTFKLTQLNEIGTILNSRTIEIPDKLTKNVKVFKQYDGIIIAYNKDKVLKFFFVDSIANVEPIKIYQNIVQMPYGINRLSPNEYILTMSSKTGGLDVRKIHFNAGLTIMCDSVKIKIAKPGLDKNNAIMIKSLNICDTYLNIPYDTLISNFILNYSKEPVIIKKIVAKNNKSIFNPILSDSIIVKPSSNVNLGLRYSPKILNDSSDVLQIITLTNDTLSTEIHAKPVESDIIPLRKYIDCDSGKINANNYSTWSVLNNILMNDSVKIKSLKIIGVEGEAFQSTNDLSGYKLPANYTLPITLNFAPKVRKNYYDYLEYSTDKGIPVKILLKGLACDSIFKTKDTINNSTKSLFTKIIKVYPNPAFNSLKIDFTADSQTGNIVRIIDNLGRIIEEKVELAANKYLKNTCEFNLTGYAPGKYSIELISGDKVDYFNIMLLK